MDTATVSVLRRPELVSDATPLKAESARTLTVEALYTLSENGRKASLLHGGNGRAVQQLTVEVPANRLHLVSVDAEGTARLKLRPRYDVKPDGHVVQIDAAPIYEQPPMIDELFMAAAKNHELERAYYAQRSTRARRRDAQHDLRAQVAQTFLADPAQRALLHPPPSPKRCYIATAQGRLLFDADRDEGAARDVPAEAHRRFRADERTLRERNTQERTRRLALHEEKKRFIAEWITTKGTPEQQARQAAGMLPMAEAIEAIGDEAFAPFREWPLYVRDGAATLQALLRQYPQYHRAVVTPLDLAVTDEDAVEASADQWARAQEARAILADATVTLRTHRLTWRRHPDAPTLTLHGLLVVRNVGPLVLRREFAVPQ
jgi:hypothetical protein